MDYSDVLFFSFPASNGGKEGGKYYFYNFFNFIYSKISKKIGFRGSAFPFPPLSLLKTGRR